MLTQSITKNSLILGAFALVTAGVLAVTHLQTKNKIALAERKAAQAALLEILPAHTHDNDLLTDTWNIPESLRSNLNVPASSNIHIARQSGVPTAAIIPSVATDGYSGDISFIVGIEKSGRIAGVRVLSHKETPGLGDKVDIKKSDWILGFNSKSLTNPSIANWKVVKDGGTFDQFTGATITPRALVKQIATTLSFFEKNQDNIFSKRTGQSREQTTETLKVRALNK